MKENIRNGIDAMERLNQEEPEENFWFRLTRRRL